MQAEAAQLAQSAIWPLSMSLIRADSVISNHSASAVSPALGQRLGDHVVERVAHQLAPTDVDDKVRSAKRGDAVRQCAELRQ